MTLQLAKPAMGDFNDLYGWRILDGVRNFHNGVDIGWLYAHPIASRRVLSAHPGTVADVGYSAASGYYITVRIDARWLVRYIHLAKDSARVKVGQKVGYGTHLATMGNTGTKFVHLHFDLFDLFKSTKEKRVDPMPYITLPYGYTGPSSAGGGSTPVPPARRRKSMSTLYYTVDDKGNLFALAGDGLGTAAWLETRDQNLANALAAQHGNAAFLSESSFASWKKRYIDGATLVVSVPAPPVTPPTSPLIASYTIQGVIAPKEA